MIYWLSTLQWKDQPVPYRCQQNQQSIIASDNNNNTFFLSSKPFLLLLKVPLHDCYFNTNIFLCKLTIFFLLKKKKLLNVFESLFDYRLSAI